MKVPYLLLALDVLGTILMVLGVLGLTGVDIGLPVLATIGPFMLVLGIVLMLPFLLWVIRTASASRQQQD